MTDYFGLTRAEWLRDKPVVEGLWNGRAETPKQVAARLSATFSLLAGLGAPYDDDGWRHTRGVMKPSEAIPQDLDDLTKLVESKVVTDDSGRPLVERGYSDVLWGRKLPSGACAKLDFGAGNAMSSSDRLTNQVDLDWRGEGAELDTLLAPVAVQATTIVHGIRDAWDPLVSVISSITIIKATSKLVPFSWPRLGAITWISDGHHSIPDTVPGAMVERIGGGTLLTIGTLEAPSLRVDDVLSVYTILKDGGFIGPIASESASI